MKRISLILLSLLMLVFILAGCGGVIEINVNFVVDGEVYDTITTTGQEAIKMPENPSKEGYVFGGWYWDDNTYQKPFTANSLLNQELSGDMSVYAKWVSEELVNSTYTVTFNSMGGSEVSSQSVKYSSLVTEPEDPTKEDYIFVGWYKLADYSEKWSFDTDTVTKDITLYAKWTEDNTEHVHSHNAVVTDPTCLLQGYTTHTCECGDSYVDTYVEPAGHIVENGVCTACGTRTESMGLVYTLNSDNNSYTLTDVGTCTDADLVIPSAYKGLPVTAIGEGAFLYCDLITSVVIPDSVTSIGSGAFDDCINIEEATLPAVAIPSIPKNSLEKVVITSGESINASAFNGCTSLTSVTIADSVTSIGNSAFNGCTSIEEATIPSLAISCIPRNSLKNVVITSGASIPENAFNGCTTLESVVIPDSVKGIEASAFYGCTSLESATLSNATRSIGASVFYNCTSLASIIIPASVRSMGDNVFYNCTSLTSITVEEENISYKSIDGVLYTKDVTTLIQYPAKKSAKVFAIPDSVTSIGDYAFIGCDGVTSITIPDSITSISAYAFRYCKSLTSITIPNSVTSIGNNAFTSCPIENATMPTLAISYIPKDKLKTVVINGGTSIGDYAFNGCKSLTSVTIGDSVTSIGSSAFYNCESLTSVTIPDSVTSIGFEAFSGCTSLTSVNITDIASWCNISFSGSSANPLYYAKKLYLNGNLVTKLVIPDSVKSIGKYEFYNCKSLTSITIPNSVTSIGNNAFYGCRGLTSVTIPNSVTSIGDSALQNCTSLTSVTIPNSVTSIGDSVFSGCQGLTSITIPNSVKSIGDYAFYGCQGLKSITIPDSVTRIDSEAFYGCTSLTGVTIGNSVTSIGEGAFKGCTSLTSVTIPDSVTIIGFEAFSGCTSLTSITIPFVGETKDGRLNTHFGYIFGASSCSYNNGYVPSSLKEVIITGNSSIESSAFSGCQGLTSVTIGDSVTSIGNYAFEGCKSLTSVTIGDSVTGIGNYAFRNCTSLKNITIGNGVTTIGYNAFYVCTSLTSVNITDIASWCNISFGDVSANPLYYAKKLYLNGNLVTKLVIPDSVTSIGNRAFCNCTILTSITIPDSVTTIGDSAFSGCRGLTSVTIPDSVTSIGSLAFYDCTILTRVTIGDSVTSIGSSAFNGCTILTSVNITDIASWCNISFADALANPLYYAKKLYLNGNLVTKLVIPDSVTSIGDYAFRNCTSLTIYCEAKSKPSGWSSYWNYSDRPVVWGYTEK